MWQWPLMLASLLCLSGCASVPATHIRIPTPTGAFELDSPKENDWRNVEASYNPATGEVHFKVERVTSNNSAEVISSVADANAKMAGSIVALGGKALEVGAAAAMKGATGGIAP